MARANVRDIASTYKKQQTADIENLTPKNFRMFANCIHFENRTHLTKLLLDEPLRCVYRTIAKYLILLLLLFYSAYFRFIDYIHYYPFRNLMQCIFRCLLWIWCLPKVRPFQSYMMCYRHSNVVKTPIKRKVEKFTM